MKSFLIKKCIRSFINTSRRSRYNVSHGSQFSAFYELLLQCASDVTYRSTESYTFLSLHFTLIASIFFSR